MSVVTCRLDLLSTGTSSPFSPARRREMAISLSIADSTLPVSRRGSPVLGSSGIRADDPPHAMGAFSMIFHAFFSSRSSFAFSRSRISSAFSCAIGHAFRASNTHRRAVS
jgi:hypothetical protein